VGLPALGLSSVSQACLGSKGKRGRSALWAHHSKGPRVAYQAYSLVLFRPPRKNDYLTNPKQSGKQIILLPPNKEHKQFGQMVNFL
jgi:hypothetical protein